MLIREVVNKERVEKGWSTFREGCIGKCMSGAAARTGNFHKKNKKRCKKRIIRRLG